MIFFHQLKYKNFLSAGNKFTEINFTEAKTTLIVGKNGAGKSTMLDALSFALFGKPHRKINKPQLLNSVNKKDCVVELYFTVNGNNFKIVRGIAPVIFEIWQNDELLNQSSTSKDYQKILEQNIIKLNHRSFHQIVVLGSSSFTPFMQLPSGQRRMVIEDLLDINVFTKMNLIVKERLNSIKNELKDLSHKTDLCKQSVELKSQSRDKLKDISQKKRDENEQEILKLTVDTTMLISSAEKYNTKYEKCNKKITDKLFGLNSEKKSNELNQYEFKTKIKSVVKTAKFFTNNDTCPTCEQDIGTTVKDHQHNKVKIEAKTLKTGLDALAEAHNILADMIVEQEKTRKLMPKAWSKILSIQNKITRNQELISRLQLENIKMSKSDEDIIKAGQEIEVLELEAQGYIQKTKKMSADNTYLTAISYMLKDSGIKTKVIREYLPVMNALVNKYLDTLNFYVHFQLNESFDESIRSRHRDVFSYGSFSEGEKQRIDLALLFTWRQIAKMKNSVATNLLILDETFDSSLDVEGVENLNKILYTLSNETNVFIISHKGELLEDKVDRKLTFEKTKNFSYIAD